MARGGRGRVRRKRKRKGKRDGKNIFYEGSGLMDAMLEMATLIGDRIAERMEARYQIMPMLTLDQAAKALDISIEKMRQLCNDGKIPFIRMDRLYRIKPADVNAFLEMNYTGNKEVSP
nr:MAG TPA: helix-turn-helix domain protein [Caudoviricetes sp.]